jgi:hypothetical protein
MRQWFALQPSFQVETLMLIGGLTERISVEINGIASTPLGGHHQHQNHNWKAELNAAYR